jgi:hypothetical protein
MDVVTASFATSNDIRARTCYSQIAVVWGWWIFIVIF